MTAYHAGLHEPRLRPSAGGRAPFAWPRGQEGGEPLLWPVPATGRAVIVGEEDDRRLVAVVGRLRALGIDVVAIVAPERAAEAAPLARADVVLIHVHESGEGALAACGRLCREDPIKARSIIAFTTEHDDGRAAGRALDAGADDFLSDATVRSDIGERVSAHLQHVRGRDALRWARTRRACLDEVRRTDVLTRLVTRTAVDSTVKQLLAADLPVTLVLLGLDPFRRVNERCGHPAGDRVLCGVARAIEAALPAGSVAGRWGGAVFAAAVPGERAGGPGELGARLLRAVSAPIFATLGPTPGLDAAVGEAHWRGGQLARGGDVLTSAATAALSRSKRAGGGCVPVQL